MVFPEEVGLGWVGARGADVRCDQYIKTWLIRRPWGLHYSTACTWEFNIRFMSLGNKNSTGKAVFQTLSIFWVENSPPPHPHPHTPSTQRSQLFHVSGPARPGGPVGRQNGEPPLVTHTHEGLFTFPSLAFLWIRKWSRQVVPRERVRSEPPSLTPAARPWSRSHAVPSLSSVPRAVHGWRYRNLFSRASVLLQNEMWTYYLETYFTSCVQVGHDSRIITLAFVSWAMWPINKYILNSCNAMSGLGGSGTGDFHV